MPKTPQDFSDLLTLPEAARYLRMGTDNLYRLTHMKKIPYYRPSGRALFRKSELDAWMQRGQVEVRG